MKSAHPMNRRIFLLTASFAAVLAASPAQADYVDSVRTQLQEQGFRKISVSSTLLGRSRIVAKSKTGTREIIMNPRTGEILRDLWSSAQGGTGPSIVGSDDEEDGKGHTTGGDDGNSDGGDDGGDGDNGDGGGDGGEGDGGEGDGGDGDGGDGDGGGEGGDD